MKDPFGKIDQWLSDMIARGAVPSAAYLLAARGEVIACRAFGRAVIHPEDIKATTETIYDIASLTKPLITTTLIMQACQRRILSLNDPIARFVAEFAGTDKQTVTVEQLLTHTAGFPAWRPIYAEIEERGQLGQYLARLPLTHPPGTKVAYSDLGFITLSLLLERIYQTGFDQLTRRELLQPLGLTRTFFNPPTTLQRSIAGGELNMDREREEARQHGYDIPDHPIWQRRFIWGEVHDGNSYFLGGATGHGGLFSTLRETWALAQQYLPGSRLLQPHTLGFFSKNFTPGLNPHRSLGWMLASTPGSAAGSALSRDAFGHTGFTGTSLWIEPRLERVYILLTNRTHPRLTDANMNHVRQTFHALAARSLKQVVKKV
ncbi:MAG: serine hydrolase domain-containing protein [Acidobacteriota bacterium]|nr:serine hydrolase domain-containing protein [Acidobacteriota bacterium]